MSEPYESAMVDVTGMSFDEIMTSRDPNLLVCVQRIVESLDDPDGIISAFQSFASAD